METPTLLYSKEESSIVWSKMTHGWYVSTDLVPSFKGPTFWDLDMDKQLVRTEMERLLQSLSQNVSDGESKYDVTYEGDWRCIKGIMCGVTFQYWNCVSSGNASDFIMAATWRDNENIKDDFIVLSCTNKRPRILCNAFQFLNNSTGKTTYILGKPWAPTFNPLNIGKFVCDIADEFLFKQQH
jgi:hypothetical protein